MFDPLRNDCQFRLETFVLSVELRGLTNLEEN